MMLNPRKKERIERMQNLDRDAINDGIVDMITYTNNIGERELLTAIQNRLANLEALIASLDVPTEVTNDE